MAYTALLVMLLVGFFLGPVVSHHRPNAPLGHKSPAPAPVAKSPSPAQAPAPATTANPPSVAATPSVAPAPGPSNGAVPIGASIGSLALAALGTALLA